MYESRIKLQIRLCFSPATRRSINLGVLIKSVVFLLRTENGFKPDESKESERERDREFHRDRDLNRERDRDLDRDRHADRAGASYLLHECVFRGDVRQLSALIRQGQDLGLQVKLSFD